MSELRGFYNMDLNQYTKIQCFNCSADIAVSNSSPALKLTCEHCLRLTPLAILNAQTHIDLITQQLAAADGQLYQQGHDQQPSFQQLMQNLSVLEAEQQLLLMQQQEQCSELAGLESELITQMGNIDQQEEKVHRLQVAVSKEALVLQSCQMEEQYLMVWEGHLERLSVLNQLYSIHFDDQAAFINQVRVDHQGLLPILEILCQLVQIYQYKGFTINFCDNYIKTHQILTLHTDSEQSTIPWLSFLTKEIVLLWEHIKQQSQHLNTFLAGGPSRVSQGSPCCYQLPFRIVVGPEVGIEGIVLREGPSYVRFLKFLTQDVKFMINFDFSVRMGLS